MSVTSHAGPCPTYTGSMKPIRGGLLSAVGGALLVLLLITAAALAATGDLTQPAGVAGCVSEEGTGPCADGHALDDPISVAVSPDGKNVYVASFPYSSNAVVRLNRDPTTGAIAQPAGAAGCVSQDGFGSCADGHGLDFPYSVAVSPDGKSVYVASYSSNAVARLNRNPTTGALTQPAGAAGCISEDGSGPCGDGHALVAPVSVAVSSDGKSVYVASSDTNGCGESTCGGWGAVARLNRNPTTGALTQPAGAAGCVNEDGSGLCADGHGVRIPSEVAVSPDGKSVYVTSGKTVARLNRNPTTGALTQPAGAAGCISENGSGPCADGHGLFGAHLGGGKCRREERVRRLALRRRRGALYSEHNHRGNRTARRVRRLRQPDRGGALRRRPWSRRPGLGCGRPGRKERLRRLVLQQRGGAPQPQPDHGGDHPARRVRRLREPDRGGALRRRPCAGLPPLGGGQPGREERVQHLGGQQGRGPLQSGSLASPAEPIGASSVSNLAVVPCPEPHSPSKADREMQWARLVSSELDANGVKKPAPATMLSMGAAGFERAGCERCEETSPGDHAEHGRGWFRTKRRRLSAHCGCGSIRRAPIPW